MQELSKISEKLANAVHELKSAFLEIQQPRTDFALKHFVVGQHDTPEQQYAQCVLELQIKYDNIRRAILTKQKIEIEMSRLQSTGDPIDAIDVELKKIDLEEQDRAMLGAWREFEALYRIWQTFDKKYTRQDLNENQEEYWKKRLTRQANQDLMSSGRVHNGNQEALRQIGMFPTPQLDHIRDVERKYLEVGDTKVLLVVATREKAQELPCIKELEVPSGVQYKIYNVWGRTVDNAYNDAAMTAVKDGCNYMLTVEDDTFPQKDAFVKLFKMIQEYPKSIVGAWYPKKTDSLEGTPIHIVNGKRQALQADGKIHEVYTIPMGCTLFPTDVFFESDFPWFATTSHLTQDSFFSQKARELGYKLYVDTSIRCTHVDVKTGKEYK